jgi:hypothetical protein
MIYNSAFETGWRGICTYNRFFFSTKFTPNARSGKKRFEERRRNFMLKKSYFYVFFIPGVEIGMAAHAGNAGGNDHEFG